MDQAKTFTTAENNMAYINITTPNVTIEINLHGRWKIPNNPPIYSNMILINSFTPNLAGTYEFYVFGLDGKETLAIDLSIRSPGKYEYCKY